MTTRVRDGRLLDARTAPGLLALTALGLGLMAYGLAGVTDGSQWTIFTIFQTFGIAAGLSFLVSALFGVRAYLRQRRR